MTGALEELGREAARDALAVIAGSLGASGQWPSWAIVEPALDDGRRDLAAPITAMGMLALQGVPGSAEILSRSRAHLEKTVRPGGMWRYYANIPPDTDDSAMCAMALGPDHPITAHTRATIEATRLPDGRFPTWYEPGWEPAIDAVPNANIVALLGEGPSTVDAIDWLGQVVATGSEVASSCFYPDPLDLHLAIRRAVDAGVRSLTSPLATARARTVERLQAGGLTPYRIAQALTVAGRTIDPAVRSRATADLLDSRDEWGVWARETLFVARRTDGPGTMHYQSWSVVTALCARALSGS